MSAICIADGSLAGARAGAAAALVDSAPGVLPLEAVFVAPGDEIYVDHEAGFLKCAAAAARWSALPCVRMFGADSRGAPTEVTARSSWTAGCWPPRAAWWRA
jgi:hypothetical protein